MTRVDIFSDFKPFFVKSPRGVYKGDKSGKLVEYHAITLVGGRTPPSSRTRSRPSLRLGRLQ